MIVCFTAICPQDDRASPPGATDLWKIVRTDLLDSIPPILLMEACGKEVRSRYLSHRDREDIAKLLKRLHEANFVQGSFYERNILVQPDPLTLPCADRLFTKPSYRIIDFGRGVGFSVDCSSLEEIHTLSKVERSVARDQRLISKRS